jgi:hypothetical protein
MPPRRRPPTWARIARARASTLSPEPVAQHCGDACDFGRLFGRRWLPLLRQLALIVLCGLSYDVVSLEGARATQSPGPQRPRQTHPVDPGPLRPAKPTERLLPDDCRMGPASMCLSS